MTMTKIPVWNLQFVFCASLFLVLLFVYSVNYLVIPEPFFCRDRPFDPWVKNYTVIVLGAAIGHALVQYCRIFIATQGYSDGKLRHPQATKMILLIATIQALASILFHYDLLPYRCVDSLGVATYPLLWFEWICTVPFMLFLVSMLDVKKQIMSNADWRIQIAGGSAVILLFLCNLPIIPPRFAFGIFCLAGYSMMYALYHLYHVSLAEYTVAFAKYENIIIKKNEINKEVDDNYRIAQWKMNCTWFVLVSFHVFPLNYYCQWLQVISPEVAIIGNVYYGFICKLILSQILIDAHIEILDPNKFLLLEERRKSEESKLMFFRYVFHEVRVPLNSLVLGLQILQDNPHLSQSDHETISLMKDATSFMSETLNDVLSLQKIEEGMLQLEFKPFAADNLVRAVLSNFKAQYESKKITVHYILEDNVPKYLMGDQFRLEHVLGNLVSNAIKFSEPESQITIRVSYETRLKGHVTFAVTDEGPGMSEEEQKCLFQPFMQIRPGELQKGRGSGLGLSICKTIVTLHNGTIGCDSKKRAIATDRTTGGSTFYFNIEFGFLPSRQGSIRSQQGSIRSQQSSLLAEQEYNNNDNNSATSLLRAGSLSVLITQNASSSVVVGERSTITTWSPPFDCPQGKIVITPPNNNRNIFPDAHFLNKVNKSSYQLLTLSTESLGGSTTASGRIPVLPVATEDLLDLTIEAKTTEIFRTPTLDDDENKVVEAVEAVSGNIKLSNNSNGSPDIVSSIKAIPRILICDDVHSNRKMLEMILQKKGFPHTECCADGSEAIALVQEKGVDYYDIIFMDNMMPYVCGPEAATRIRQLGCDKLLIGVTGNAMEVDVLEYETAGADAVMVKPVKVDNLQRLMEYCQTYGYQSIVHCQEHKINGSAVPEDLSTGSENRLKQWLFQRN